MRRGGRRPGRARATAPAATLGVAAALVQALFAGGCGPGAGSSDATGSGDGRPPVHDPLSMPASPTLDRAAFAGADRCGGCHPEHHRQWRTSGHAYAMQDPVFQALVMQRQVDLQATEDQFCTQCHSAIGTRSGDCVPGFSFEGLSDLTLEGVTCEACHRVTDVERPFNSGHRIDPAAPMAGPFDDPRPTPAHASTRLAALSTPRFCAGCHDVRETSGLPLERPYEEWSQGPASADGPTCQGCHMPASPGPAAVGGPQRMVHSHRFAGVAAPLLDGFIEPGEVAGVERDVAELFEGAATLRLTVPESARPAERFAVQAHVRNEIVGHSLPTGTTFLRQLWLALTVRDADGRVLYRTGHLDDAGDLRDVWSELDPVGDPDLVKLTSDLIDAAGSPTPFPWRATDHASAAIPPLHERTYTLFVDPPDALRGPVSIEAQLRFRSVAPWLLRRLGLDDLVDRLVVRDLATASATVPSP